MTTTTIKKKLTKAYVDSIKPPAEAADEWHYDTDVPGFCVRVQKGGSKTYVARYRTLAGTPRKMKLARTCDMHPDKARDMAKDVFARVAKGEDPVAALQELREAPTLLELKTRFMAEHSKVNKKAASQRSDKKNWAHVLSILSPTLKVRDLDEEHMLKLKTKLADRKATCNQVIALMSKALNLAETWKMRPRNSNPCRGVKKFAIDEKELILNPEQIKALNVTLLRMTAKREIRADFADFIRLLMLTGCRKCEIMHAKASWFDLHQGLLLLPDSKTGQARIPLTGPAFQIAEALLADGREWLIPGQRNGQPLQTPYKIWKAVKKAAGLPMELRLHDLRHTAGSLAHMAGAKQKEIQVLLRHKQLSTTERYIHAPTWGEGPGTKLAKAITGVWGENETQAEAA